MTIYTIKTKQLERDLNMLNEAYEVRDFINPKLKVTIDINVVELKKIKEEIIQILISHENRHLEYQNRKLEYQQKKVRSGEIFSGKKPFGWSILVKVTLRELNKLRKMQNRSLCYDLKGLFMSISLTEPFLKEEEKQEIKLKLSRMENICTGIKKESNLLGVE